MTLLFFVISVCMLLGSNVRSWMELEEWDSRVHPFPVLRAAVPEGSYTLVLVSYDTLIRNGAINFSKEGVDTFAAVTVVEDDRLEEKGIYVGARDWLIKLDSSFNAVNIIEIPPPADHVSNCKDSRPAETCHNFIKYIYFNYAGVMARIDVCGTNAWAPACSERMVNNLTEETVSLQGLVTSSPSGTVAHYVTKKRLFVALSDHKDAKIYTTTLNRTKSVHNMRSWLNEGEVVGVFSPSSTDKFVYFVFKEKATSGDEVYSRVARICKDDVGNPDPDLKGLYVSFTKATLNCSSHYPLVQSVSYLEGDPYFWATFTSEETDNGAICGFSLSELDDVFRGPFMRAPVSTGDKVIKTCFGDRTVDIVENYVLMKRSIQSYCKEPFIAFAKLHKMAALHAQDGFTALAGDDKGRVWKVRFKNPCELSGDVQVWQLFPQNQTHPNETTAITGLAIHNGSIIVLTHKVVMKIPVEDYPGDIISIVTVSVTTTVATTVATTAQSSQSPSGRTFPDLSSLLPNNVDGSRFKLEFWWLAISLILILQILLPDLIPL